MKVKIRQVRIPYSEEEKFQLFVEGKVRVPNTTPTKKERQYKKQNKYKKIVASYF